MKIVFTVRASVDEQFVERLFNIDPFEYYDRILKEAIGADTFLFNREANVPTYSVLEHLKSLEIKKLSVSEMNNNRYNTHEAVYVFEFGYYDGQICSAIGTALTARFGIHNIKLDNNNF